MYVMAVEKLPAVADATRELLTAICGQSSFPSAPPTVENPLDDPSPLGVERRLLRVRVLPRATHSQQAGFTTATPPRV